MDYWDHKESGTTERLSLSLTPPPPTPMQTHLTERGVKVAIRESFQEALEWEADPGRGQGLGHGSGTV